MSSKIYFPNITGLRFIAALIVIIGHHYLYFGKKFVNAHLGVVLFFCLSGFLITTLLLKEIEENKYVNIGFFFMRRILRIWPLYFLITLIGFSICVLNLYPCSVDKPFITLLYYLFFMPNVAFVLKESFPFTGILWSIGSEEQFYIVWPFVIIFIRKHLKLVCFTIFMLFNSIPYILDMVNIIHFGNYSKTLSFWSNLIIHVGFQSMATGALGAWMYNKYSSIIKRFFFSSSVQLFLYISTLLLWISDIHFSYMNDQFFSILFTLIILNLAYNRATIVSLENNAIKYLGKISYGLYVYHTLIFGLIRKSAHVNAHFFPSLEFAIHAYFFVGLLITIAVSAISFEYFESYFISLKNKSYSTIETRTT